MTDQQAVRIALQGATGGATVTQLVHMTELPRSSVMAGLAVLKKSRLVSRSGHTYHDEGSLRWGRYHAYSGGGRS